MTVIVCASPGCEDSATWAIHVLPFDDPHAPTRPLLVCDAHASVLDPLEDPARPRRGVG